MSEKIFKSQPYEEFPNSSTAEVNPQVLRDLRLRKGETQEKFWRRFGVSQATGSRYELGVFLPKSLAILTGLYVDGRINDELLDRYAS